MKNEGRNLMISSSVFRLLIFATVLLCAAVLNTAADEPETLSMPAFPGAEGFGAVARGGRGGRVIKVTNLNPRGPGSLQEACSTEGPRIIVFDVSGVIVPDCRSKGKNWLSVKPSYVTIAGQTAPGAGITIQGMFSTYRGERNDKRREPVTDVIARFLRIRPQSPSGGRGSNLRGVENKASRAVFDHISVSWSTDDCFCPGPGPVTIQWCTVEESDIHLEGGDEPHNFAMHMGSGHRQITVHHTLFAHHHNRVPLSWAYPVDFRNNIIYNAGTGMEVSLPKKGKGAEPRCNVVGNYSKPGLGAIIAVRLYAPPFLHAGSYVGPGKGGMFGVNGNYRDEKGGYAEPWQGQANVTEVPLDFSYPLRTHTAEEAYGLVLGTAGCMPRDKTSERTAAEVRTGTGMWGYNGNPGGPIEGLSPGRPPADTDNDGMPDTWEKAHGLDPRDSGDNVKIVPAGASRGDRHKGYTYIEYYINELADLKAAAAMNRLRLNPEPASPWDEPANELPPGAKPHKSLEDMVKAIQEQTAEKKYATSSGWYAVQQLSRMGEKAKPAVDDLIKILNTGSDPRTVCFAAWALGAIGPAASGAVPDLISALKKEQNTKGGKWSFKPYGFIAWALGRIGPAAADAVPALAGFVHGRDNRARNPAAWALSQIGPAAEAAMPVLIKALKFDTGGAWSIIKKNTQVHAVRALVNIGVPAVPELIKVCEKGGAVAKKGAVTALGRIGPGASESLPVLLRILKEGDEVCRGYAADALVSIDPDNKKTVHELYRALDDKAMSVRHKAVRALGGCGASAASAVSALERVLKDERKEVRRAAALALGKIGKAAFGTLKRALEGDDPFVRKYAARAISKIGKDSVPVLIKALSDTDAEVRREAVWSLGRIGNAAGSALTALKKLIRNDSDYITASAAEEGVTRLQR